MEIMFKNLLLSVTLCMLFSCAEKIKIYSYPLTNPDPTPSVAPDTVTLALDREYPLPGAGVNDVVLFRVRDTMLFYSENRDGINRFNIYDIKNGRTMQSLVLTDDKYDNEALARSIIADVEPDTVMLHHQVISGRLLRFAIDDLVKGEVKPVIPKQSARSYMMPYYYKGYYIGKFNAYDSVTNYVTNPETGYERLYKYIPDNARISYRNINLKGEEETQNAPRSLVNNGPQVVSHKRGVYVFASYFINHLAFYDLNDDFILKPIRMINDRQYAPWFRAGREKNKTEFALDYQFHAQIQPSHNFVYLLFYGFRKDDEKKHSAIVKYDWSGDLKAIYHIPEGLCYSFAVTEDDKRMFLEVEKGDKVKVFEVEI